MKKEQEKELRDFLETLNIHNKDLKICFNDALAVSHIERLISKLLKEQRESPMGVSQWKKHGKKHGYWEYFNKQQREEDISELGYEIEAIFSKHKIPCICPKGGIIDEEKMLVCNECEGSEWTLPQSLKEINYKISNLIKSLKE